MALSRRSGNRFQASIWPGFVDAMTGLLLVLMFVITIFMVVQYVLRDTISGQETKLDALSIEISELARALGLEQRDNANLEDRIGALDVTIANARDQADQQAALIAALTVARAEQDAALFAAQGEITNFEAQVAGLLTQRDSALGNVSDLEREREGLISQQEALQLAMAQARDEIDVGVETARLAAAKRAALEALIADINAQNAVTNTDLNTRLRDLENRLTQEEQFRLAEAAAAIALQERLKNADTELTAMTLALEEQRRQAEDTLTLLAAAQAAGADLDVKLASALLAEEMASDARDLTQAALTEAQIGATATSGQLSEVEAALALALLDAGEGTAQVAELQMELVKVHEALSATQADLRSAARATLDTKTQLSSVQAALATALAQVEGGDDNISDLQFRLSQSEAALVAANAQSGESEKARARLEVRLAEALAARTAADAAARAQLDAVAATLASTQNTLARAIEGAVQADSQLSSVEAALAVALANVESGSSEITALQIGLSESEAALAAAGGETRDLDAQRSTLETRLAEALAAKIEADAAAKLRLSAVEATLARALAEADGTTAAIADLRIRLSEREAQLAEAEGQFAGASVERSGLAERLSAALIAKRAAEAAASDQGEIRQQLAAALAANLAAKTAAAEQMTAAEQRAALLATANRALQDEEARSAESQRQTALLSQQVAALHTQLAGLQALLDDAKIRDVAAKVQLQSLGSELNTALARVAAEQRKRAELEEAERKRLEHEAIVLAAEAKDLARYKSEFFGRMRDVIGAQEGVRIVGDRFVFSSEVLFPSAGADLSVQGQEEVAKIGAMLRGVINDIPEGIDWVIRVDGHTDNRPLSGFGKYFDNWELSQARALSVVRYMANFEGIPPNRLAANGFGEFQPVNFDDTEEARAQNRRIELKLTER